MSVALSATRYRYVDRATKVAGVLLLAAGLKVGGDTVLGLVLGGLGVAVGLTTVFIQPINE